MKREELLKQLGEAAQANKEWKDLDDERRKSLSKVLGAGRGMAGPFDYERSKEIIYSWPEIYYEIGRLREKKEYVDLSERIGQVDFRLEDLEAKARKDDQKL